MKLSYTEFSFGYAFTENLIRSTKTRPSGAPTFPNLVQEADLGYDVRVECPSCPLFFQYLSVYPETPLNQWQTDIFIPLV